MGSQLASAMELVQRASHLLAQTQPLYLELVVAEVVVGPQLADMQVALRKVHRTD
jgi:hypothetical protein